MKPKTLAAEAEISPALLVLAGLGVAVQAALLARVAMGMTTQPSDQLCKHLAVARTMGRLPGVAAAQMAEAARNLMPLMAVVLAAERETQAQALRRVAVATTAAAAAARLHQVEPLQAAQGFKA